MYSSLATKYRPKKFKQIVGQPDVAIIKSVVNDFDCLPPLLLFCGPSGVGKTTIARVIASYLNCSNLDSDGEPCGTCSPCLAIYNNNHPSVYEMDAGSHGSADQLREIVVKCHLSSNGVKVFILDEAQSISGQGWNVLLKVLEEPPPDCLFMLLTSEPRKVPPKIRTRALRFNFKPVAPTKLRWYLGELARHSGTNTTDTDLDIITEMSEGSVRDALMMLDQCSSSGITAQELFAEKDLSLDYLLSILRKDYTGTLAIVENWWGEVGDAKTIVSQLALSLEKLALAKNNLEYYKGPTTLSKYAELIDGLDPEALVSILTTVSDWFTQVYAKAQIVMLTSKLYKVVNGSEVIKPVSTPIFTNPTAPPAVQRSAVDRLSAL